MRSLNSLGYATPAGSRVYVCTWDLDEHWITRKDELNDVPGRHDNMSDSVFGQDV